MTGERKIYAKKILFFILGYIFIPRGLALTTPFLYKIVDFHTIVSYFQVAFLIIYLAFPVLYRKDMPKRFPNKYMFYALQYFIFWILGIILALYTIE